MSQLSLGIDIGGTFTDVVVFDHATGRQSSHKELTTHADPTEAAMAALDAVLAQPDIEPTAISRVVHATTLFTNALIERGGARTGLITTAGFRDVVEIGRERKYDLYDINIARPAPIARSRRRAEVRERIRVEGSVGQPLDVDELIEVTRGLVADGVESVAVVFLHAYRNPTHEQAALAGC